VIAADGVDADVGVAQFLELLRDESEFRWRRRFAVEQIAALQKEVCAFRNRKIDGLRERLAQTLAANRELAQIHFAVITSQVIVGGANEFDHVGFLVSDFGFDRRFHITDSSPSNDEF
jgi:hypothetical protein